jgi:hypothetical protein
MFNGIIEANFSSRTASSMTRVTPTDCSCSLGLAEVGLKLLIVAGPPSLPN